jgi:hypothetical protein
MSKKNEDKFIPYSKSSKKEKKKRDNEKRNKWEIPPYSKVVPSKSKKSKESGKISVFQKIIFKLNRCL